MWEKGNTFPAIFQTCYNCDLASPSLKAEYNVQHKGWAEEL